MRIVLTTGRNALLSGGVTHRPVQESGFVSHRTPLSRLDVLPNGGDELYQNTFTDSAPNRCFTTAVYGRPTRTSVPSLRDTKPASKSVGPFTRSVQASVASE